jgi:hypothetical protein
VAFCSKRTVRCPPAILRWALALCWIAIASAARANPPGRPGAAVEPRAHVVKVERAFLNPGAAALPGAGVRAFQDPEADTSGVERFDIRWYANPPGIPPGAVIVLEAVQANSPSIHNRVLRIPERALGHMRSVVEIPADDIQRIGRVRQWRVSVVWRGRILARQASPNWKG